MLKIEKKRFPFIKLLFPFPRVSLQLKAKVGKSRGGFRAKLNIIDDSDKGDFNVT